MRGKTNDKSKQASKQASKLDRSPSPEFLTDALKLFAATVHGKFSTHVSGEPEDQIRGPFETLMTTTGLGLGHNLKMIGETLLDGRLGRPDYGVTLDRILCGFVELKAPGKGADPTKFKGHDKQQWERFKSLPNLLYTDGIEWTLSRSGNLTRTAKLTGNPCFLGGSAIGDMDAKALLPLVTDFLNWEPIVPSSAKQLASYLAPLCRMLKNDVLDALKRGSPSMMGVANDWRRYLFPDADNAKFADSYAQTVTFALLLARSNGADTLFLDQAVNSLTSKNTLLGRALQVLTDDRSDVGASLDMLQRVIRAVPTGTMTKGKRDPWLHFYEDFLQEYDPKLRKDAGAYYTPLEVVHAQTVLVDDILRTRLNKPMGFAEGGVTTLDPAVGTGTYLLSIVDHAMRRVAKEEGDGAVKARASLLAQSLYGFEIMVGPYAVSALRMTRFLQDFGGGIPGDGVQIFLNNTLESPHEVMPELPMMYRAIGLEHQRAKRVKESVPVLVCIGNPPYGRHEAANATNKMNTGAWVRWGESKNGKEAILNDFIEPVKRAGKGGQLKNLYNLYVYFWRWGLWKVFEQPFAQTGGVVSFITASSFLDGDAFLGMRHKMRELCDEIWIIDLGGSGRGTQQDDNVFAIQTPVAITIAVRYNQPQPSIPAQVHYTSIEGSRAEKLGILENIYALDSLDFTACPESWDSPFLPRVSTTRNSIDWPKLTDLMPWQHSGSQFKRNWPIAPTEALLETRWAALLSTPDRAAALRESRDRKINSKVCDIFNPDLQLQPLVDLDANESAWRIRRYGFRSFDRQHAIVDNRVGDYLRPVLWQADSTNQFYFASTFSQVITNGPALTVSADVPDLHYFNGRGAKDIIPLFRDDNTLQANLHPELLTTLTTKLQVETSAQDWACYMYGVMAHSGFTGALQNELGSKDVRVPVTLNNALFQRAVELGKRLLYLHSYGERFANNFSRLSGTAKCLRAVQFGVPINTFNYDANREVLMIGDGEFGPVTKPIWEFEVSGLKVLQSWLGYRMSERSGKKSSPLDLIGLAEWPAGMTSELLHLLWVLENTLVLYPEQAKLLAEILNNDLLLADDLGKVPDAFRRPPKSRHDQVEMELG